MPALDNCLTIEDLKGLAHRRVPKMFFDYADSGSWTETKIKLRQRVAVNMEGRTLKTDMLGIPVAMPVALAPTGLTGISPTARSRRRKRPKNSAFRLPFRP